MYNKQMLEKVTKLTFYEEDLIDLVKNIGSFNFSFFLNLESLVIKKKILTQKTQTGRQ